MKEEASQLLTSKKNVKTITERRRDESAAILAFFFTFIVNVSCTLIFSYIVGMAADPDGRGTGRTWGVSPGVFRTSASGPDISSCTYFQYPLLILPSADDGSTHTLKGTSMGTDFISVFRGAGVYAKETPAEHDKKIQSANATSGFFSLFIFCSPLVVPCFVYLCFCEFAYS